MFYTLEGVVGIKKENFFTLEVGGFGMKIFTIPEVLKNLPEAGNKAKVFTSFVVKEDAFEIYGFLTAAELQFFESLNGVTGIGPKSALNIMKVDKLERLIAAISEGKPELLTKASGVGKKTAERAVLELRGKLAHDGSGELVGIMEADLDIVDALANLGYTKMQAKNALSKINPSIKSLEERIRAALKVLKGN
ncbi:MAG: Holliday junction branch migration protein RuvA [Candidatus Pacebacteria bacterium]|nr:Holliday junction branch migration protein RuvA [Candidatus Paceibacterota bacterium]